MKNRSKLCIFICFIIFSFNGFADNKQQVENLSGQSGVSKAHKTIKKESGATTKPVKKIQYIPPFLGAPSNDRLQSMGVRSTSKQEENIFSVLTPPHTGLTTKSQPILYWFTSSPIPKSVQHIEFVLNSEQSIVPILRVQLSLAQKNSAHPLVLADYGIMLKPEINYSWSIALVKNSNARSNDLVSSGKIRYVNPSIVLQQTLRQLPARKKVIAYAQAGYWYEAIKIAIDQQTEQPENLILLLKQNNLQLVASYYEKKQLE